MNDDGIKVVVIDDDPRLLKAYNLKFTNEGISTHIVNEPVEAIEIIRNVTPHVIILDVLMPTKNGWDILHEIVSDAELRHIPVLLVSNISSKEKEAEALSSGAAAYLVKSDTPLSELVKMVRKLSASE